MTEGANTCPPCNLSCTEGKLILRTTCNLFLKICDPFATRFDNELNIMIKVNIRGNGPGCSYWVICIHNAWGIWRANGETGLGGHFLKAPI